MEIAESIFVSIASYRDPELIPTLKDMLHHAAQPQHVHIAVCQQDEAASEIFQEAGFTLENLRQVDGHRVSAFRYRQALIEVIHVHYYASQGACWARSLAETLFRGERYFLQIDSHCRFIPQWDREMIAMLRQLRQQSPRPIISAYPPGYAPGDDEEASKKTYVSRLTFNGCSAQGLPTFSSVPFVSDTPVDGSYLAGGFIFTDGDFVTNVPNDPHIFFIGEEIAMAVRAFTHGYDIYHPHKILLWHFYNREENAKVWSDHSASAKDEGKITRPWWEVDKQSKLRVRTLLGLEEAGPETLAPWTLGNARTLRQFEYRAGLSLQHGTILPEVAGSEKINVFTTPPEDHDAWLSRQFAWHKKKMALDEKVQDREQPPGSTLHVSVYSQTNRLLYKRALDADALGTLAAKANGKPPALELEFKTESGIAPCVVRLCRWSAESGWGDVTEKPW